MELTDPEHAISRPKGQMLIKLEAFDTEGDRASFQGIIGSPSKTDREVLG